MPTPSIQTLRADAQQVLNLDSISAVRSVVAATLANANAGTPLNPNLTTQQLWNEFYQIVTQPKSDIESIIANQLMKFLFAPPAPGGAGADKQVIFNDGGVLAGDPQFLWNKTTNLLTVTGAATITGDLTVDTNTLKVDSANNRVGIGTASPLNALHVLGSTTGNVGRIVGGGSGQPLFLYSDNSGSGVNNGSNGSYGTGLYFSNASNFLAFYTDTGSGGTEKARIDSSGNVGIGVAPSAWSSFFKALQIGNQALWSVAGGNGYLSNNTTFNTSNAYVYRNNGFATEYIQSAINGVHAWYNAPSGTAGQTTTVTSGNSYTITAAGGTNYTTFGAANNNVGTTFTATSSGTGNGGGVTQNITFTQAMTLDASGNLLVGKTVANGTVKGTINQADGTIWSTLVDSTSASNTLLVYSTGASAYRFYVSLDGTVNATNATISAISDARFKENVQDIDVGLGAILALKPRKFDWKEGKGKNIKGDRGFIAQEFEQVFPQLVDEWKDAAPEGEAPYKSVRQDLIPVLVKAIQELTARVQTLETR